LQRFWIVEKIFFLLCKIAEFLSAIFYEWDLYNPVMDFPVLKKKIPNISIVRKSFLSFGKGGSRMLSPSLEDYLEEIYQLSLQNEQIRIRDIAERLNVSSPSVVKALRKLHKKNYVQYQRYQGVELTEEGERLGNLLVKRNSILQEFLYVINSHCNTVQEAEAMEHYLSPPTISAIEKLVEFMKREPDVMKRFMEFCEQYGENHWNSEIEGNESERGEPEQSQEE